VSQWNPTPAQRITSAAAERDLRLHAEFMDAVEQLRVLRETLRRCRTPAGRRFTERLIIPVAVRRQELERELASRPFAAA
jgi:hypothetical protein